MQNQVSLRCEVQMPLNSCEIPGCLEYISTFWQTLIWVSSWCPNLPPVHTLKTYSTNLFDCWLAQRPRGEGRAASHQQTLELCLGKTPQSKAVPNIIFSPHCRLSFHFFSLAVAITVFLCSVNILLPPHKLCNDWSGNKKDIKSP